jgi:flagellar protein FliJ
MAKYRFRLETLRKLRASQRDEMRRKLAEAHQAAELLAAQQAAVAEEIVAVQEAQRRTIGSATTDVNQLLEAHRYQAVLRAQQHTLMSQAELLAEEVERRRRRVIEADRQVRVLDKLDERKRREHQQVKMRAEVKELDEVASRTQEVNPLWPR